MLISYFILSLQNQNVLPTNLICIKKTRENVKLPRVDWPRQLKTNLQPDWLQQLQANPWPDQRQQPRIKLEVRRIPRGYVPVLTRQPSTQNATLATSPFQLPSPPALAMLKHETTRKLVRLNKDLLAVSLF